MPADSHLDWDAALLESSGAPDGFVLHTCPMTVQIPGWWIVCAYLKWWTRFTLHSILPDCKSTLSCVHIARLQISVL